ncbi:MAG: hypothetical protein J6Y93_07015, partial [Treponema sp.]|nr:hypothetical protein [Treponema sp.]
SASTSPDTAASFTVRSDVSPWCVYFNSHIGNNTISVFADDWFVNERLSEHCDYYVLWGVSGSCSFEEDCLEVTTGCRFGSGLDFFVFKRQLEFFAQAVWNPYFGVKKESGTYSPVFVPANLPLTTGLRVWF